MGSFVAKNIRTWAGGFDFTGETNNAALNLDHEVLDDTRFQPLGLGGARQRVCGLEDVSAQSAGLWSAGVGSVDENAFTLNGTTDEPLTMSHDGAEGSPAYMMRMGRFQYQLLGQHGQLAPFSLAFAGTQGLTSVVRGLVTKTKAAVSATGATGTAVQVGAAASGTQFLYGLLHCFAAPTTITAVLESAPDNTFAAPTTRITFGPITAVGGYWAARVAGPITDPWYRLRVTAITGTATIAAIVGVR